ncbi:biotin/lipoyl attachment domain-containing protein [Chlorobaculum parvum NCIB 8327]|uniref:Biotin/lipoyl attachment domain-containing protein n=1 Tax=Chlorobaculum parvum (strain DSM 263 / NCIMB 8327) TaxID=517417 RepID=B3QPP4_CHLP8|nr:biotin/lipoyl attachment domain-containing protein [Chlorobaculum parvum NCIB 8327]
MIWGGVLAIAAIAGFFYFTTAFDSKAKVSYREYRPAIGDIRQMVSTTATVKPQNRLEIKSPVSGRIDQILVKEGDFVKKGQVLALISSTERAALLDAATQKGQSEIDYWNKVYNQTALISPIDGQVIVSDLNPGQTITTSDAVLVLSDRLIVQADVDETDIGNVQVGQRTEISLDAYPEISVEGVVDHIYYESTLVNNVNIYYVDILPARVPDVFRSGMSANVDIIVKEEDRVLTLPHAAVKMQNGQSFVLKKVAGKDSLKTVPVQVGLQDDSSVEIVSGLSASDVVLVENKSFELPKDNGGSNPFMPQRKRDNQKKGE